MHDQQWNGADDVRAWVECPIGVCPGQLMSADLFDLSLPPSGSGDDCVVIDDDNDVLVYTPAQGKHHYLCGTWCEERQELCT